MGKYITRDELMHRADVLAARADSLRAEVTLLRRDITDPEVRPRWRPWYLRWVSWIESKW